MYIIHGHVCFHRKILNESLKRPVSIAGNEMHYITSTIIEKKLLFLLLVSSPVFGFLRQTPLF